MAKWRRKDLLGLEELSPDEIELILQAADSFKEVSLRQIKKVPALKGLTIVNLFFESSTRTRISFELAEKRLSADTINFFSSTSSVNKGETLIDTVKNIEAMKIDLIVIRHPSCGSAKMVASVLKQGVINAGDGSHEHPTQGLLDIYTIKEKKGRVKGLNISIVGDIEHSRVARSNIWGLTKLGANVTVCGPSTLIPCDIQKMGVCLTNSLEQAVRNADVVNMLRIQTERQGMGLFPSIREYQRFFGLDTEKLQKWAKPDILIMHPGPVNRGIELTSDVVDGKYSVILEQVTNGVAVRMAVLFLIAGVR
ncbi:aspartate carbamoyltransferase [bacterium Unc6]|nr:aspartate carbamoyltransferase [bacterium Unc6]